MRVDIKAVLAWVALATAMSGVATGYVRLRDVVPKVEALTESVADLEKTGAVADARWDDVKDRLGRIERKLDRMHR